MKPEAPIRLYYDEQDGDVLPEEASRAARTLKANGADATAVSAGAYDHGTSALHDLPEAITWFTELADKAE